MNKKKILFITLLKIRSLNDRGLYNDLLKKFVDNGHELFIICPNERRNKEKSKLEVNSKTKILSVKTLNIQKTNLIEKGLATLTIEYLFLFAVKKYYKNIDFDLIIYSTPPITFTKIIEYIKKRTGAYSYLLLKDIFPQNAIDMGFLKRNGLLHMFFRLKEKKLYNLSDSIGCMSKANLDYIKKHNPFLNFNKLEVNPNTITPKFINYSNSQKESIKLKYSIPLNKKIFIYGGNLGKPQGLDFLLETIQKTKRDDVFFLVIGSGTEFKRLKQWFNYTTPKNALLMSLLPKNDYDLLLAACDVGLIFLNKNFTIPNYPSRLLSYLEMKMPVIAATDSNTDIGKDIENNNCGFSVISGNSKEMQKVINKIMSNIVDSNVLSENAWNFIQREFKVERSYELIMKSLNEK
jgi:glycosyltransferase involved in cell wall biosynthesis